MPRAEAEPTAFAREVLDIVGRIPAGRVLSYGDVAAAVGIRSGRAIGMVMYRWGDRVPWHRVVMADGSPKPFASDEHLALLRDDGTPLEPNGRRVDMRRARWEPPGG